MKQTGDVAFTVFKIRSVATDLVSLGTDFERQRLLEIESGVIKPNARQTP